MGLKSHEPRWSRQGFRPMPVVGGVRSCRAPHCQDELTGSTLWAYFSRTPSATVHVAGLDEPSLRPHLHPRARALRAHLWIFQQGSLKARETYPRRIPPLPLYILTRLFFFENWSIPPYGASWSPEGPQCHGPLEHPRECLPPPPTRRPTII